MRRPLLSALAGIAVSISLAGPAHGDPDNGDTDAAFLASLKAAGITYNGTPQVIGTAQSVCRLMTGGSAAPQVLTELRKTNPGLTEDHAAKFIAIAAQSYCPDQLAAPAEGR